MHIFSCVNLMPAETGKQICQQTSTNRRRTHLLKIRSRMATRVIQETAVQLCLLHDPGRAMSLHLARKKRCVTWNGSAQDKSVFCNRRHRFRSMKKP